MTVFSGIILTNQLPLILIKLGCCIVRVVTDFIWRLAQVSTTYLDVRASCLLVSLAPRHIMLTCRRFIRVVRDGLVTSIRLFPCRVLRGNHISGNFHINWRWNFRLYQTSFLLQFLFLGLLAWSWNRVRGLLSDPCTLLLAFLESLHCRFFIRFFVSDMWNVPCSTWGTSPRHGPFFVRFTTWWQV